MIALQRVAVSGAAIGMLIACGGHVPNSTGAVATGTAPVIRTDIVSHQQLAGTLTYAGSYTVINQAGPGIYTALPAPGSIITRGHIIYRVDGRPIPLFYGAAPAWRRLSAGVAAGPDIRELQANLVALGFAPTALRIDNRFDWVTAAAVRHWQASLGLPQTGVVGPGDAIYMPGAIRITAVQPTIGMFAQPGQTVIEATSTHHTVLVELNVALESLVKVGDAVTISLPDGVTTAAGKVTALSTVAVAPSGGGQQNGPAPDATITVTVTLDDAAAAGTLDLAPVSAGIIGAAHQGVLAVPVTALLAQPDGKYAVDVLDGGQRRMVTVVTGLYDDRGLVEVTSQDLHEGMLVEVPIT